jgi:hypothetical protein
LTKTASGWDGVARRKTNAMQGSEIMSKPDEYTIRTYPHGVAIFGEIPMGDIDGICKMYKKRGMTLMHMGIASALGATLVLVGKDGGKKWEAEINACGDWLKGTDTGVSSKTIYSVLSGINFYLRDTDVPHDPDDFGRCYRLLKRFPGWRERMGDVAEKFPAWKPFVREWGAMTDLYEQEFPTGQAPLLYAMMQKIADEPRK